MPTTKRLLTDETGQALVTAINNIVAAVKPNATEIQMSSSDTTTVATAISNINDKIGTVPSGQTVEGQITTLNSNMGKQVKQIYYGNDDSVSFSLGSGSRHILLIASSGALAESAIVFVSVTNAGAVAKGEAHKGDNITSIDTSVNNRVTINWNQTGNRFYFDIPLAGDLMEKV